MGSVDLHIALGYDIEEDVAAGLRLDLEDAADWAEFAAVVAAVESGPWRRRAACKGHADAMFTARGQSVEPARALCRSCPVIEDCRAWGDRHELRPFIGFLAGESARERRKRRGLQPSETEAA